MLEFQSTERRYGPVLAVAGVSKLVVEGEFVALVGASGSGKSTLLKMVNRLIEPSAGSVTLDGRDVGALPVTQLRRGIGYVFQGIGLFPHMTVGENIAFAMPEYAPKGKQARNNAIEELLGAVGLEGIAHRAVNTLSGGQQARISLLRTLASQPDVVLLDEPFSKLDLTLRGQIRSWTFKQLQTRNIPAVLVTHDKDDAMAAGGDIIELSPC